jgi:hypothetical protein
MIRSLRTAALAVPLSLALAACGGSSPPADKPCPAGQSCAAPVYVACFVTNEVRGVTRDLQPAGIARPVGQGPVALFLDGDTLWVSDSLGAPEVDAIVSGGVPTKHVLAAGGDLEYLRVHDGRVYVSNTMLSTVTVLDAGTGGVVDEVSMAANAGDFVNPRAIDFVGSRAYVALPGGSGSTASFAVGQEVAVVDFSTTPGHVVKRVSMNVPGAFDAPGLPFPYRLVAAGTKVYVALANLKLSPPDPKFGSNFTVPAGNGRLAVIDTAANDAVSVVDLGAACQNPGGLALDGSTLWVACASGAVVPVAIAPLTPAVGSAIAAPSGVVPGNVTVCRGAGYVTDQFSGSVARFETAARTMGPAVAICPVDPIAGFAFAADVACVP